MVDDTFSAFQPHKKRTSGSVSDILSHLWTDKSSTTHSIQQFILSLSLSLAHGLILNLPETKRLSAREGAVEMSVCPNVRHNFAHMCATHKMNMHFGNIWPAWTYSFGSLSLSLSLCLSLFRVCGADKLQKSYSVGGEKVAARLISLAR